MPSEFLRADVPEAQDVPFLSEEIDYDEGFEDEDFDHHAIEVTVPEGLKEGDLFIALVGDEEFEVIVPRGFRGGDILDLAAEDGIFDVAEPKHQAPADHQARPSKNPKAPRRQVSFTEEEPSVMLFRPELGGLGLDSENSEQFDQIEDSPPLQVLDIVIPENVVAGDVLEVESADGETLEVVVPEGMEAGMKLTVESPKGKPALLQFEEEIPLDQDQAKQVEAVKDEKEKSKDAVATAEQSEPPPLLEFAIPENASAGDVLHVESADGEKLEVVVPEGMEAGMKLTVESPKGKPALLQFEEEIPLDQDQAKQVEAVKDEKEKGKDAVATAEQSIEVMIPEGVSGGDILQVESDTGETVEVVVPEGMEAGMMLTIDAHLPSSQVKESTHLSTIEDILPETPPRETILSEVEMDAILKPVSRNLVEKPVLPPNDAQRKVAMPLEKDERAESDTTGGAQWKTLAEYGGGEVMKLRRWSGSGSVSAIDAGQVIEDVAPDSGKVDAFVQTESVDFTIYAVGLKAASSSAWGTPALPPVPSCGLHCKMPLLQETNATSGVSVVAMKLALEALQREKEELEQKLKASQKEVLRLELRDEDEIKAIEARQNVLLRQENDELRKIALGVLRRDDEGREVCRKKKVNKMERKNLGVNERWLKAPPKETRVKSTGQVTLEDVETPPEAVAVVHAGHAGGSHGVRRTRGQSDCPVPDAQVTVASTGSMKRRLSDSEKGESGQQVLASPCSSVRDPMKPVVRLKPRDPKASNKFGPNPGSCRSSETKKTWRLPPDIPDQKDQRQTGWSSSVADARLATASIYSAAALNADALGWGATAAAAESVGMCKEGTTAMAQKQPQNAMMQPLNDTSEVALVCERAVNGAFVLESGQQEPDLHCADEFNESDAHEQSLAKEDEDLRAFYVGSAYSSGSRLADCCPAYSLVDDGNVSGVGDAVPLYRHVKSGCLLLSYPVSLVSSETSPEDIRLFFCRGPLPLMRRYGRGVLGCMEILFELFADTEGSSGGRAGSEFYGLCEGPGYENTGETGGSAESLCYLPILVDKHHACSPPSRVDASGKHSQCFIKLPDMAASAGFAFETMEKRLKAEMYHNDGEGRAVRLLAHFLSCLGRAEEAAVHWQQAYQEDEAKLGSNHLQTATSSAALAACFDDLGRSEEAEAFHRKALAAMAKNFGRSSSEAVACELDLAACRHVQGKCKLHGMLPATQSGVLCLEGATAQAIAAIFGLAAGDEKEAEEAEPLYRQGLCILRRSLGPGHADTLHCLNNLALCLADQGKLQQAEQLLRRTVAGMEVVLAPTHPRPIQALSNLACCLADQGKSEEAETHHRRAFENAKRRLGWQHSETLACAHSLSRFLTSCGRSTEAALLELQADQLGRPCWKRGRT